MAIALSVAVYCATAAFFYWMWTRGALNEVEEAIGTNLELWVNEDYASEKPGERKAA